MGQIEVYNWLKKTRKSGDEEYFSIDDVKKGLKDSGIKSNLWTVRSSLIKLSDYNYLDVKLPNDFRNWRMKFRIKEKYLED